MEGCHETKALHDLSYFWITIIAIVKTYNAEMNGFHNDGLQCTRLIIISACQNSWFRPLTVSHVVQNPITGNQSGHNTQWLRRPRRTESAALPSVEQIHTMIQKGQILQKTKILRIFLEIVLRKRWAYFEYFYHYPYAEECRCKSSTTNQDIMVVQSIPNVSAWSIALLRLSETIRPSVSILQYNSKERLDGTDQ